MKKIVIIAIFLINLPSYALIDAQNYDSIIPSAEIYQYKEPIHRPKWQYPLAWTGYIGTLGLIPFPLIM